MLATVVGAFCGALLSFAVAPGPWGVGVGILAAMLLAQVLNAGDGARVAGYICGIVLLDHSAEPWSYAFWRFVETALGVLTAWSISGIPKLFNPGSSPDKAI